MITKISQKYGKEGWSTGTFISGIIFSQWLLGAIDYFNTADRHDQKIRKDLVEVQRALNKVLYGPKHKIRTSGQEDALDELLEDHHNIIYQSIGLNDRDKINQVVEFIKKLNDDDHIPHADNG
jgi:hypothetical protein